jgi:hypothetical protein
MNLCESIYEFCCAYIEKQEIENIKIFEKIHSITANNTLLSVRVFEKNFGRLTEVLKLINNEGNKN